MKNDLTRDKKGRFLPFTGTHKTCSKCHKVVPIKDIRYQGSTCISCHCKWKSIYAIKNRYGLSMDQYNTMLTAQNHRCFLCGSTGKEFRNQYKHKQPNPRKLVIDHEHKTGKIRKMLCSLCNTMICKEDPALLRRAADYIENQGEIENVHSRTQ